MRTTYIVIAFVFLMCSCKNTSHSKEIADKNNTALASEFIDAFYSFDRDRLQTSLSHATTSQPSILYYQKWAECGNYNILRRQAFIMKNDSTILCPITVRDDLMPALDMNFNVTDTFRLTIKKGRILSVDTSSNDPNIYYEAKAWVKENRNELIKVPCEGIWEDGPTPCGCIKAMIKGFGEFMENERQ